MAAPHPLIIVLSLVISGASLQASARLSSVEESSVIYNYQLVDAALSNPYKVLLAPEKHLIARQESDANRRKDITPEQRERLKERRKRFESLPPEEKLRLKEARKKFKQLPPEERKRLKQKWRDLSPEERDKAIKKQRQKKA
jgi:hypothetical protein